MFFFSLKEQTFFEENGKITCLLRLGSFGVMSTNLQVKELHNLLLKSCTGPHIGPDIQYGRQKLLPQVTHPHPTVHGRGSQEDVEGRDEVLQNRQVFLLPNSIVGVWNRKSWVELWGALQQLRMMVVKVLTWRSAELWRRSWTEGCWILRSACSSPAPACGWLCSAEHGWWVWKKSWTSDSTNPKDLLIKKRRI